MISIKRIITLSLLFISIKSFAACDDPISESMDWSGCIKRNVTIADINLKHAKFINTTFLGYTKFHNVDMYGVKFDGAKFDDLDYVGMPNKILYTTFNNISCNNSFVLANVGSGSGNVEFKNININRLYFRNSIISASMDYLMTGKIRSFENNNTRLIGKVEVQFGAFDPIKK